MRRIVPVVRPVISDAQHGFVKGCSTVSNLVQFTNGVIGVIEGASRSVKVQFVNFNWWVAFVLDGVLSERSNTMCQIRELFVRIDSMSFRGSAGESLGTNILHFGY
jgi:hypothetical protein